MHRAGGGSFLFGSDFPHEVSDAAKCRHEIGELLAREDLAPEDKEAVLGENAVGFLSLRRVAGATEAGVAQESFIL